jgi:hypothetical protein
VQPQNGFDRVAAGDELLGVTRLDFQIVLENCRGEMYLLEARGFPVVILLVVLVQEFTVIPDEAYRGSGLGSYQDQIQSKLPCGEEGISKAFNSERGLIGGKQQDLLRLDETVDEVGVMTVELHFLGDVIAALLLPLGPPAAGFVSPVQSSQVLNPSS